MLVWRCLLLQAGGFCTLLCSMLCGASAAGRAALLHSARIKAAQARAHATIQASTQKWGRACRDWKPGVEVWKATKKLCAKPMNTTTLMHMYVAICTRG